MVKVPFKLFVELGKCDLVDSVFDYEVSEADYQRLKNAFDEGEEFSDCDDIADIYDDVYEAADSEVDEDLHYWLEFPDDMD